MVVEQTSQERYRFMATELPKYTVEVYDNETGEHYERPATAEELAYYAEHDTVETDETPSTD